MSDEPALLPADEAENPVTPQRPRRSPLARLGCGVALVIWGLLLLTPCFFITLAVRGEISLDTGPAPEQRLRIWLIMEADERGLGISTTSSVPQADLTCIQTDVRFVLWEGEAEPVSYCHCYEHPPDSDTWNLQAVTSNTCTPE